MLKPGARADHGYILRTRSLELDSPGKLDAMDENSQSEEQSSAMALHSSFDAAYTRGVCGSPSFDSEDKSDFRTSWDETDPGSPCDLSGKKHLLQLAGTEILEANPPRTIRKVARRTGNELSSKTPARPRLRPPGSAKKPCSTTTPTSAMKRRRAPLPQRQSPMRRVPLTSPPSHRQGLSSTPATEQSSSIFSSGLNGISFVQSPPALTPTRQGGTHGSTMKSMSKWHNTGTTTAATTVLETTLQSDTSSPTTRFRFTSFPASLPRVNNPRNRQCPDSVRKRMNFAETSVHSDANQSRDDDGTQNTSISSLSGEGGHHHHLPLHPGTHPPSILELGAEGVDRPVHGQLFPDEDFGYSDDDSTDSPGRGLVGRTGTRLNFNMVMSPKRYHDEGKRASGTLCCAMLRLGFC